MMAEGSSNRHTPGPWEIDDADEWGYIKILHLSGTGDEGAEGHVAITNHEPDAHLIAAAPELLVALKWALAAMDRGDGVLEYTGDIADGERAKAAIAKAEGRE